MGLRFPPKSTQLHNSKPTHLGPSESSSHPNLINNANHNLSSSSCSSSSSSSSSSVHPKLPSMVTNYTKSHLIELNCRSDDSCLVVISNKVYDLTLWLDEAQDDDLLASLQLRSIASTDPLAAGRCLADRLGTQIETRIADCRIGDFEPCPVLLLPPPPPSSSSHITPITAISHISQEISSNASFNHATPSSQSSNVHAPSQRPSHLARALALVEFHKKRVIEAESKVGSAHISLAEAFEGLAQAEKKRDHLVMLACEGCRPTLPEWEEFANDQPPLHPSPSL